MKLEQDEESKLIDIQVCPKCLSPKIRRVGTMEGDMSGHIAHLPPKYKCLVCRWSGRLVLIKKVSISKNNEIHIDNNTEIQY